MRFSIPARDVSRTTKHVDLSGGQGIRHGNHLPPDEYGSSALLDCPRRLRGVGSFQPAPAMAGPRAVGRRSAASRPALPIDGRPADTACRTDGAGSARNEPRSPAASRRQALKWRNAPWASRAFSSSRQAKRRSSFQRPAPPHRKSRCLQKVLPGRPFEPHRNRRAGARSACELDSRSNAI